ncbi:hypothetical protein [Actinomadura hibisca]|uniref:hypothetical protein n=1 Tax=Actinomadura hibisca TaxID=68565 RepID=UPI00082B3D36|nr:hypothetical protein [Actinomadura hibisca]
MSEHPQSPPGPGRGLGEAGRHEAAVTADQSKTAVREVAGTAAQQSRTVAEEGKAQAQQVVREVRDRVGGEVTSQTQRAAQTLRQWSDDLARMASEADEDSPARQVVHQIADGGRQTADYLEDRGVGGVVEEVQNFARRRPGMFLAGAALAGFAIGRMAKAAKAQSDGSADRDGRHGDRAPVPPSPVSRPAPSPPMPAAAPAPPPPPPPPAPVPPPHSPPPPPAGPMSQPPTQPPAQPPGRPPNEPPPPLGPPAQPPAGPPSGPPAGPPPLRPDGGVYPSGPAVPGSGQPDGPPPYGEVR